MAGWRSLSRRSHATASWLWLPCLKRNEKSWFDWMWLITLAHSLIMYSAWFILFQNTSPSVSELCQHLLSLLLDIVHFICFWHLQHANQFFLSQMINVDSRVRQHGSVALTTYVICQRVERWFWDRGEYIILASNMPKWLNTCTCAL